MKDKLNQYLDVVLLSAPYDFPPRHSLALSIFKTCLTESGMTVYTIYAMFRMAELLGFDVMSELPGLLFTDFIKRFYKNFHKALK